MMRAALEADLPKKRGFKDVSISPQDLSNITRYDGSQKAVAHRFHAQPKEWPKVIDKITDESHKWKAPIAATLLASTAAWQWLLAFITDGYWQQQHIPITATWRSKLFSPKLIYTVGNMVWLVIASCSRGLFIWLLEHLGSNHCIQVRLERQRQSHLALPCKHIHVPCQDPQGYLD